MHRETIALRVGYEADGDTKSVAVPIYQTVAFASDSAEVLEQRVAALEGGVGALCVSTGQAALHYSVLNLVEAGGNIVSVPQLAAGAS